MKHLVSHPLSPDDARRAVDAAFAEYARRFASHAPQLQWRTADRAQVEFHALGRRFEADVQLLGGALQIELEVPLMARPFVGRATRALDREVARWVGLIRAQP